MEDMKGYLQQVVSVQRHLYELYSLWQELYASVEAGRYKAEKITLQDISQHSIENEITKLSLPIDIGNPNQSNAIENTIRTLSLEINTAAKDGVNLPAANTFTKPEPPTEMQTNERPSTATFVESIPMFVGAGLGLLLSICITRGASLAIFLPLLSLGGMAIGSTITKSKVKERQTLWDAQNEKRKQEHSKWFNEKWEFEQREAKHIQEKYQHTVAERENIIAQRYIALEAEMHKLEDHMLQLQQTYNNLMEKNIIHPKYRNIVACTTMLEYFETSRVSALEGPNGAYNLYENEIRTDRIIAQLEDIKQSLARIEQNQYTLAQILRETNKKVDDLNKEIARLCDLSQQQLNTQQETLRWTVLIATTTAAVAANTEAIKYLTLVN